MNTLLFALGVLLASIIGIAFLAMILQLMITGSELENYNLDDKDSNENKE